MKKTLTAVLALTVALLLGACGGGSSTGGGKAGGTLRIALDAKALCYTAGLCYANFSSGYVLSAVLQPLVEPANNDQAYEPVLAESITPAPDLTSFTVKLKPGTKWSDGTDFTAAEVATLFTDYLMAPTSVFIGSLGGVKSVTAPDAETVVFELKAPDFSFPLALSTPLIWKPVKNADVKTVPVGTGPYRIETVKPTGDTTVVRNENYAAMVDGTKLPYFDQIDFTVVPSGQTRVNSFRAGQVDVALSIDPVTTDALDQNGANNFEKELVFGMGVLFNAKKAPFDDVRVRRALAAGIDKESILAGINGGEPRTENWLPDSPWFSEKAEGIWPTFDEGDATALLAEYVDDETRSDGKPAGTPLSVELKYDGANTSQQGAAVLLQQQWEKVGAEVKLVKVESQAFFGDAASGNYGTALFSLGLSDPPSLLSIYYSDSPGTTINHYSNPELVEILAAMKSAKTPADFNAEAQRAEELFAADVPFVWINSLVVTSGLADDLAGAEGTPYGYPDLATLHRK